MKHIHIHSYDPEQQKHDKQPSHSDLNVSLLLYQNVRVLYSFFIITGVAAATLKLVYKARA